MPLVREYQMDGLKQRIDEYFMRCEQPSIHKLFLADEFSMPKAKQRFSEYAKR